MASPKDQIAANASPCVDEIIPLFRAIRLRKAKPEADSQREADSQSRSQVWCDALNAQVPAGGCDFVQLPVDKIKLAVHRDQLDEPKPAVTPQRLTPAELHQIYAETSVPQHRYFAPSLSAAANSPVIAADPAKWLAGIAGVNLSGVVEAWLNTNHSVEFEQLNWIGVDPNTSRLSAILTVKQGYGYSGGPLTAGSREYVAFWVDWGKGFQYEGTTSVTVHDFSCLPPAGLEYNVFLPVDLLSRMQPGGKDARTVKVRAVLSWNTPPSTTDPKAPVVWGHGMESLVQIPSVEALRAVKQLPAFAVVDATEIDLVGAGGRIIAAAIKTLAGMAFGPDAGLTVVPDGALTGHGAADRTFTMNTMSSEGRGYSFALYAWDRTKVHRGAISNLKFAPAGFCRQVEG
jgi:hypothetical protein